MTAISENLTKGDEGLIPTFSLMWLRGRVVCALDYEADDPGSIPGSGGTTDWLFSSGW